MRKNWIHTGGYLMISVSLLTLGACSTHDGPYAEDSEVAPYGEDGVNYGDSRNSAYTTRRPASSSPKPWASGSSSSSRTSYPVAKAVPGKAGRVYSPFAQHAGEVDVSGLNSGTQAKCPYTGNIFIVP
jgi:hypothetical protein